MDGLLTKISKVEVLEDDITFYFDDSPQPFSVREFEPSSATGLALENIEYYIRRFNNRTV